MPPITSTFEAFSSGQRHSRCVYSARKKTKLTRSPISNLRGDLGGSCGDREVLNLLQNLLLLPLLTCWLVGLEVKARMGISKDERNEILSTLQYWTLLSEICMRFIRTSNHIWMRSWEARTSKKHSVACWQFDNSWMSVLPQLCDSFLIAERQHATDGPSHKLVRRVGRSLLVCLWLRGNWVLPTEHKGNIPLPMIL